MATRRKAGEAHFRACGVENLNEYLRWCRAHHFRPTTNKTWVQQDRERRHAVELRNREALSWSRDRRTDRVLTMLEDDRGRRPHPGRGTAQHMMVSVHDQLTRVDRDHGPAFLELLRRLERVSKVTSSPAGVAVAGALVGHRTSWVGKPDEWRPTRHNHRKQLAQLSRHLLCRYPVPTFMDRAWLDRDDAPFQTWFIHIGQGGRLTELPKPALPITKRIGHHFLTAPRELSIMESVRFAQLRALGGSRATARAVAIALGGTPVVALNRSTAGRDEFAQSILRYLLANQPLTAGEVALLADYVWSRRYGFQSEHEFDATGRPRWVEAAQPNLTLTGRSVATLLADAAQWRWERHRDQSLFGYRWEPRTDVDDLEYRTGSPEKGTEHIWRISEMTTGRQLIDEGQAMSHCVASYAGVSARRSTSVWSLAVQHLGTVSRRLTIEVQDRLVIQARGRFNRQPEADEREAILLWAWENGLDVGRI